MQEAQLHFYLRLTSSRMVVNDLIWNDVQRYDTWISVAYSTYFYHAAVHILSKFLRSQYSSIPAENFCATTFNFWMHQEEFLADLVSFLESRGHGRLIPPAGVDAFPEVVLNGKRLDLYNLYREVFSLTSGMRTKSCFFCVRCIWFI